MSDSLSRAIVRLYKEERFYAELVLHMDRIISEKILTAGVCIKDKVQLHVNLKFFESLTELEQVAILKHECQHILNNHIVRAKEIHPEIYIKNEDLIDSAINNAKHKVINVAADCSINPGIPNIMSDVVFPKTFNLENGQTMEWYLENLKNNEQLNQMSGVDGHELWAESSEDKEILKEKVKKLVNKAAQNAKAAGHMSADTQLLIDKLNYKPMDWKATIKQFAARMQEVRLESSKKKRNRRYGIMYPGVIKEDVLHLGVAIDTSGSVSDEALCQFMAEIGNIAKYAKVTVVEADCEIKAAYVFDPKKTYTVNGRGGTDYAPAFNYFTNETDVDGVIYFGDMDCFDKEEIKKPKYQVLWAVVGTQAPPVSWGRKLSIEVKKK